MSGSAPPAGIGDNPYVGPRPFRRGERIYGRDREIRKLFYLLSAERIVLLHSPSGAGKSSLITAGLLPLLAANHFYTLPFIRVGLAPGESPAPTTNRYVRSAILSLEEELPPERRRPAADIERQSLREYLGLFSTSSRGTPRSAGRLRGARTAPGSRLPQTISVGSTTRGVTSCSRI